MRSDMISIPCWATGTYRPDRPAPWKNHRGALPRSFLTPCRRSRPLGHDPHIPWQDGRCKPMIMAADHAANGTIKGRPNSCVQGIPSRMLAHLSNIRFTSLLRASPAAASAHLQTAVGTGHEECLNVSPPRRKTVFSEKGILSASKRPSTFTRSPNARTCGQSLSIET